jgi:DNA polymerase-1
MNLKLTTLNLSLPTVVAERTPVQVTELYRLLGEMEMRTALADARKRYDEPELF